jgi:hypothetical protein
MSDGKPYSFSPDCVIDRIEINEMESAHPSIHDELAAEVIEPQENGVGILACRYAGCVKTCLVRDTGKEIRLIDEHEWCRFRVELDLSATSSDL